MNFRGIEIGGFLVWEEIVLFWKLAILTVRVRGEVNLFSFLLVYLYLCTDW